MMIRRDPPTLKLLLDQPLFEDSTKKELLQLAGLCAEVSFGAGDTIVHQGQLGREVFVLLDGEASVERDGEVVASAAAGSAVGESSLLTRTRRNATVTAISPVSALVFSETDFETACDASSGFKNKVVAATRDRTEPAAG